MNDNRRGATLVIDGRSAAIRVFTCCLCVEVALVLLDYYVNYGRLTDSVVVRRLANIAREDGVASWFASTQTLLLALTCWLFCLGARESAGWRRAGWILVATLFTYMAIDDAAQLHERLGAASRNWFGASSFPTFMWHVVFGPVFAVTGLISAVFLYRELDGRPPAWLLLGGFGLFGFAMGLDFLEGLDRDHPWNLYMAFAHDASRSEYETLLHFSRSLEEFVEMFGTTSIWAAILTHLNVLPHVSFR